MDTIVSLDIGLFHMGYVLGECQNFKLKNVLKCELVNIKKLVYGCDCSLDHRLCISNYMEHFFKLYGKDLAEARYIVVEQQPPTGFISIQEIIRYQYGHKVVVISPRSMHKHYNMGELSYDDRKKFTVDYSKKYLSQFPQFHRLLRKHDMADSFMLLMYFLVKRCIVVEKGTNRFHKNIADFAYDGGRLESTLI